MFLNNFSKNYALSYNNFKMNNKKFQINRDWNGKIKDINIGGLKVNEISKFQHKSTNNQNVKEI